MANNLYGFNKITNARFLIGEIENGFSLAENINGSPSNMKVIVVNAEREEYQINTIVYHDHTDTWWVINNDTSLYLPNGVYQHEIELIEGFEWFNYRTMIDCAFKKERYTLETLLERLFRISNIDCDIEYANFIDKDFVMPFFAFNNFTIASALKQISGTILAIPKLKWTNGSTLSGMTLYFISRIGDESLALITNIDTSFPVAYEQNSSTSDQYKTRAVSNISNAKSQELVLSPKVGGFQISTATSFKVDSDKMSLFLPSRIDHIEYVSYSPRLYFEYVQYASGTPVVTYGLYNGHYFDVETVRSAIYAYIAANAINITTGEVSAMDMPAVDWIKVNYKALLSGDAGYVDDGTPLCGAKTLLTKREYDETTDGGGFTVEQRKSLTWHWLPSTNEIIVPPNFNTTSITSKLLIDKTVGTVRETIGISIAGTMNVSNTFFKVAYRPVADIKISYDNNYEAQDEKYYNQNGQLVDAGIASKLMLTDVLESAEGTKIRQSRHNTWASCIKLGQLVKYNDILWVVNQRSIEYTPSKSTGVDGYYSVIYNLSKDRIARSENINADSSIIDFAPPDKNLVERNQLMKDYVELSLDETHNETAHYVDFFNTFNFGSDYCGLDLNFMFLAKSELDVLDDREYMVMPSLFELTKSKLVVARFPDNNFIGQRLEFVTPDYIQTTINYVEADGSATNIYGYFLSEQDIYQNNQDMIGLTLNPELLPFNDYPELPEDYLDVLEANSNWSIKVGEASGFYDKDPFEIPVFSYQFQINNSNGASGQIVVSDDILKVFGNNGTTIYYRYLISPTIRFTNENALSLWNTLKNKTPYIELVEITKGTNTLINSLFSLVSTPNSTALQGKHIGIYAITLDGVGAIDNVKFLYAVNFYQHLSNSTFVLNVNNWKI